MEVGAAALFEEEILDEGVDSGELGKFWGQAAAEAWGNAYGNVGCTDAWSRMMYGSVGSNVWTDW